MSNVRGKAARVAGLAAAVVLGAAALPAAVFAQAGPINIELSEFAIKASATSASAGTVNFASKNVGANNHELVIVRSSAASGSLPLNANNAVDEAQVQIVRRMDRLASGTAGSLSADLTPGSYILLCNIGTHYQRGMNIAFTVSGAAAGTAAPSTGGAAAQAAPAAPKSGTGGYLEGGSSLAQLALGGLALVSGAAVLGATLGRRRSEG